MNKLIITTELTYQSAQLAIIKAGGKQNDNDSILDAITQSRTRQRVHQAHVLKWNRDMWANGYRVVDVEIH